MQENSWSGLAGFFSTFSYAYGKLLKFDKVKSNAEFLIQSARESSQEISGAVNPAYIMSTFLPVHTFGGFAIQFCCKPIFKKFRFSLKNLLCSTACTVSIFSAFKLPLFFPSNSLFFWSSFLLQSLVLSLQELFRHSFIFKFQHSGTCPNQTLFPDVPSQRSQSDAGWYVKPESKAEVIHQPQNCLLNPRT